MTESTNTTTPPRDPHFDAITQITLKQGYQYIQTTAQQLNTDIFEGRVALEKVFFLTGPDAAELMYDNERFIRKGVIPFNIRATLMGSWGVQHLDGEAHRHRKAMFMQLMTPQNLKKLTQYANEEWESAVREWATNKKRVSILVQSQYILTRAICRWAGVPLRDEEVAQRASDLFRLVDAFGSIGPRNWKGIRARKRLENWLMGLVRDIRNGRTNVPDETAAKVFSLHRDLKGELLSEHTTAEEILNIIRPTVACCVWFVFIAQALNDYPQYRQSLQTASDTEVEQFVQEVRRFYPFTPLLGAYTIKEFEWKGVQFPKDRLCILDVYGINHDARTFEKPYEFNPEHIAKWDKSPYNFIPQGGGDYGTGHRCAGEWVTLNMMKICTRMLVNRVEYDVPEQNLSYSISRMPTYPRSGFVIEHVTLCEGEENVGLVENPKVVHKGPSKLQSQAEI